VNEVIECADAGDLRLIEAIRALVPIAMRLSGEPGLSLALARRGRLIWKAAFGFADLASQTPMTPDHVFKLGSMAKPYVATAIMQLVEQGRLGLDDRADRHLPFKVENPLGDRPVTIRDLLTHQSGLGMPDCGDSQVEEPRPLADLLEAAYARPFHRSYEETAFPTWTARVGEAWQYSNLGAATLGLVVEKANGEGLSTQAYVERRIMGPLGMTRANFPRVQDAAHLKPEVLENLAPGYARLGPVYLPTPAAQLGLYPAGSLMGTPAEHLRLLMATIGGGELDGVRILRPESVVAMLAKQRETQVAGMDQGLVWRIMDRDLPKERISHNGAYPYGYLNAGVAWTKLDGALVVSSNSWAVPLERGGTTLDLLQAFVGEWLLHERTAGGRLLAPSDTFAASYLKGLQMADALNGFMGHESRLSPDEVRMLADRAQFQPGANARTAGWDAEAFVRGFEALRDTPMTAASLAAFRESGAMEVPAADVQWLYEITGAPDYLRAKKE
jgi:CubicO group peptidase (beta-lactamase class C family)